MTNWARRHALIALLLIGCAGIAFGLRSIYAIEHDFRVLGHNYVPALRLVLQIESGTAAAVEEAFAYVISGDVHEKEESEGWFRRLPTLAAEFRRQSRIDEPGEAEERALFGRIMASERALEDRAIEMFSEYERTGAIRRETFERFEEVVDQCSGELAALVAIEADEVEESFALVAGSLSNAKWWVSSCAAAPVIALAVLGFFRLGSRSSRRALRAEARTSAIVESAAEGIITVDHAGIIESANPALSRMFGFETQELIGKEISILVPAPHSERLPEYMSAEIERDERKIVGKRTEVRGKARDGRIFPVEIAVSELKTDVGQRFIGLVRDLTGQKAAEHQIESLAYYDTLTGLPNRNLFQQRLEPCLRSAKQQGRKAALLFIDLDNFKKINDSLGHSAGDAFLQHVSTRLIECLRRTDAVVRSDASAASLSRIGGDEFTILLPDVSNALHAAKVAERIQSALSEPFVWQQYEVCAQVSTGIAVFPDDGEDAEILLRNADTAMYHAKDQGRNNFQFYGKFMNRAAQRNLQLAGDLRSVLEREELTLHYQTMRDAVSGEPTAAEALLRWNRPGEGFVSPEEFLPVAEETGLIIPIGDWVLRTACAQAQAWQSAGFRALRIAVNVAARQFQQPNWAEHVARILEETGLSPAYLELELTESAIMQNDGTTLENLQVLSKLGVGLCLDDFGTGFSSLSYLNSFPISRIKIDRSFVGQLSGRSEHASVMVEAILAMASCLSLGVVAEGVETERQVRFLREHGCHELQGNLLSPPIPADEFLRFFEEEKEQNSWASVMQTR